LPVRPQQSRPATERPWRHGCRRGMSAAPPATSDRSVMRNCRWGCIGNVIITMRRDHRRQLRLLHDSYVGSAEPDLTCKAGRPPIAWPGRKPCCRPTTTLQNLLEFAPAVPGVRQHPKSLPPSCGEWRRSIRREPPNLIVARCRTLDQRPMCSHE
jgi:hypothetical protein